MWEQLSSFVFFSSSFFGREDWGFKRWSSREVEGGCQNKLLSEHIPFRDKNQRMARVEDQPAFSLDLMSGSQWSSIFCTVHQPKCVGTT